MKITISAVFLLLCILPSLTYAEQESPKVKGEIWEITVSDHSNRCKNIGVDFSGTHDFVLIVKTDTVRVIHDRTTGITYHGKINIEEPQVIHYTASYQRDAGILSERITFNRENETHGNGESVWFWGDGLMSCGGGYSFTADRKEQ